MLGTDEYPSKAQQHPPTPYPPNYDAHEKRLWRAAPALGAIGSFARVVSLVTKLWALL